MATDPTGYPADSEGTLVDWHVGKQLRIQRLAKSLSVGTVAQALGVLDDRVRDWEEGTWRIPALYLLALRDLLSCSLAVFFKELLARIGSDKDNFVDDAVSRLFIRYCGQKH